MKLETNFSLLATLSRMRTSFIFVIYAVLTLSDHLTKTRRNLDQASLAAFVFDSFSLLKNNKIVGLSGLRDNERLLLDPMEIIYNCGDG